MCTKHRITASGRLTQNSVVEIIDRPDMISAVYHGRKALLLIHNILALKTVPIESI